MSSATLTHTLCFVAPCQQYIIHIYKAGLENSVPRMKGKNGPLNTINKKKRVRTWDQEDLPNTHNQLSWVFYVKIPTLYHILKRIIDYFRISGPFELGPCTFVYSSHPLGRACIHIKHYIYFILFFDWSIQFIYQNTIETT